MAWSRTACFWGPESFSALAVRLSAASVSAFVVRPGVSAKVSQTWVVRILELTRPYMSLRIREKVS